jgi:hypothetical protein
MLNEQPTSTGCITALLVKDAVAPVVLFARFRPLASEDDTPDFWWAETARMNVGPLNKWNFFNVSSNQYGADLRPEGKDVLGWPGPD